MGKESGKSVGGKRSKTLSALIKAFCLDYKPRSIHIMRKNVSRRVQMEYEYINGRIFDGAAEIVGVEHAEVFIEEIGNSIGYANSSIPYYSEKVYKQLKQEAADNIARKLHLLD